MNPGILLAALLVRLFVNIVFLIFLILGTTIYPGMQITAVVIYRVLGFLADSTGLTWLKMSLNDVCVFIPCWFGTLATMFLSFLTYECSGIFTCVHIYYHYMFNSNRICKLSNSFCVRYGYYSCAYHAISGRRI